MEKKKEGKHAQEDFSKRKKLPQELKNEQNKSTMKNIAIAIFVTVYFIFLNLGYQNIAKEVFVVDAKVFGMVILAIAIILFERAFRKQKGELIIYGIEMLVLSIITLFVPYIYYLNTDMTNVLMITLISAFDVYYVSKSAVICAKIKSDYIDTLSDIKTIVKKEKRNVEDADELEEDPKPKVEKKPKETETAKKPKRTIKEDSEDKKVKEPKKEEAVVKVQKENKQEVEKEVVAKKKEASAEEKPKRATKTKTVKEEELPVSKPKTTRKKKTETEETKTDELKTTKKTTKPTTTRKTKTTEAKTQDKVEKPKSTKTSTRTRTTTATAAKKTGTKKTTTRKTTKKEEEK